MKRKITILLFVAISIQIAFGQAETLKKVNKRQTAGLAKMKQFTDTQGTYMWSFYDATKRASNIFIQNGKLKVLSETQPDAATEYLMKLATEANVKVNTAKMVEGEGAAKVNLETATTIAQLGVRNVTVNMQRDALYRLSELANNMDLKDTTVERLFALIITQNANIEVAAHRADSIKAAAVIAQATANTTLVKKIDSLSINLSKTVTDKTKSIADTLQLARKEIADLKKQLETKEDGGEKGKEPKKWKVNIDATLKEEK